jgi:hypothetical protein
MLLLLGEKRDEMFRVRRSARCRRRDYYIVMFFAGARGAYAPSHLLFVTRLPCFPPVEIASTFIIAPPEVYNTQQQTTESSASRETILQRETHG